MTKNRTFMGDTLDDARNEMTKWLAEHGRVVVTKEYPPVEMRRAPGEIGNILIRIEFEEPR